MKLFAVVLMTLFACALAEPSVAAARARICLTMIVKNEATIVERALRSVKPLVDCWSISDTGSTDGTQDIVRRVMGDLPGVLTEDAWVDFATNRNIALRNSLPFGEMAFTIDADDTIEFPASTSAKPWRFPTEFRAGVYNVVVVTQSLRCVDADAQPCRACVHACVCVSACEFFFCL